MAKKKVTFEESIARLEEIVKALERGEAPLDESLSLFEEGTAIIKGCSKILDDAEQKIVMLQKGADGKPEEVPFAAESL